LIQFWEETQHDLRWLVLDVVIVRLSKAGKSHDHQFDEEQDEDGHEANALDPRVFGDGTGKALIGQCFIGRRQKLQRVVLLVSVLQIRRSRKSIAYMYESGGHDDTRAKVFCDEEGP
jgi:hypothetical protein